MKTKIPYLAFAIIFLFGAGAFPHPALAYFATAPAEGGGGTVSAGTLAFSINTATTSESVQAGASVTVSTDIADTGSIGFQYATAAQNVSCDPTFEGDLTLTATRDGTQVYNGPIAGFASTTDESSGAWSFQFALASGSAATTSAECSFDLDFSAWQTGMPTPASGGFSAMQDLHVTLAVAPPPSPPSGSGGSGTPAVPIITSVSPATGTTAGGDTVTVTGSGFTGATEADFGASPGTSLSVTSDTSITVTSPPGSGVVDITVIAPGGTSATSSADQFTYQ